MANKDTLFKPRGTSAETKAATTDKAFRDIVETEARMREAKTARLREARLARDAQQPPAPEQPKKTRKKAN